jgi:LPXTG-site transpeptidase (sortase) family protein
MFETKYSKFLTILLVIIIVAIIGLAGYLGYNYYKNYTIGNESDKYVSTFIEQVGNNTTPTNTTEEPGSISENITPSEVGSNNNSTSVKTYKGYPIAGSIEIPKTNVKYPIFQDPPTVKKLELAVATLYPQNAVLNTPGNVVIVGHNYRNGLFFSNNKKLSNGDSIYITDLDGKRVIYKIYNIFQAEENDTSFYNRDTDGAMEITLSTCTDDSSARIIIEARAE